MSPGSVQCDCTGLWPSLVTADPCVGTSRASGAAQPFSGCCELADHGFNRQVHEFVCHCRDLGGSEVGKRENEKLGNLNFNSATSLKGWQSVFMGTACHVPW